MKIRTLAITAVLGVLASGSAEAASVSPMYRGGPSLSGSFGVIPPFTLPSQGITMDTSAGSAACDEVSFPSSPSLVTVWVLAGSQATSGISIAGAIWTPSGTLVASSVTETITNTTVSEWYALTFPVGGVQPYTSYYFGAWFGGAGFIYFYNLSGGQVYGSSNAGTSAPASGSFSAAESGYAVPIGLQWGGNKLGIGRRRILGKATHP